jgi:hypothetical protein
LRYDLTVTGVRAEDVYAVVIRREDTAAETSPWRVVERLSGPGVLQASGAWQPNAATLERLERGELWLELFTREHPRGAARAKITPPPPP